MAKYTAIADTSEYLIRLLRQFCVPDPVQNAESIGLVTASALENLALGLRLHDIQAMNPNQFKPNCVPLRLRYKLSAHSSAIAEQRAQEEYKILGRAICVLAEHPVIFAGTEFLEADDCNVSIQFENIPQEDWRFQQKEEDIFLLYSVSPILLGTAEKAPAVRVKSTS